MSAITTSPRRVAAPLMVPTAPVEERGVMRGVSWNLYDRLTDAIGERSSIMVAFDGKDVEIMVVGPLHEAPGDRLGLFIDEVCDGLDLDSYALGRMTWKRREVERGLEADLCYCFDPAKVELCRAAEARGINDGAAFPIPDLMVEVDISPPQIDRDEIYSKLRPPEVWKLSNEAVSIEQLDASGNYVAADASRFLHVRAEEITRWLRDGKSAKRTAWKRAILDWARTALRARAGTSLTGA